MVHDYGTQAHDNLFEHGLTHPRVAILQKLQQTNKLTNSMTSGYT
jgi:hypothetical protein